MLLRFQVVILALLIASVCALNLNVPHDIQTQLTQQLGNSAVDPNHIMEEWLQKCSTDTGIDVRNRIVAAATKAQSCIASKVNIDSLLNEIDTAVENKKGELDEVFKRRCDLIPNLKECRKDLVDTIKLCLSEYHKADLDILMRAIDGGLEYVCHNGGERLALFLAEDGVECFSSQAQDIAGCLNSTAPLVESWTNEVQVDLNRTTFTETACKIDLKVRACVEDNLNQCKNPTTANLVEGLMRSMTKETPCYVNAASFAISSYVSLVALLPTFLVSSLMSLP